MQIVIFKLELNHYGWPNTYIKFCIFFYVFFLQSFLGLKGIFVLNISLNALTAAAPASESNDKTVLIDHIPSWKAHKNSFHVMKLTDGARGD